MDEFERKHVHSFYREVSDEFSGSRNRPWSKIEEFYRKYVASTDLILDAGSGNGINTLRPRVTVSVDYSKELLEISKQRAGKEGQIMHARCDLAEPLPFRDSVFDVVVSVAVLHHLCTEERRRSAIKEMIRVAKPGGYLLIYIWSDVPGGKQEKFERLGRGEGGGEWASTDVWVSWKKINRKNRYYHLFAPGELENLVTSSLAGQTDERLQILDRGHDRGNNFLIFKKNTGNDPGNRCENQEKNRAANSRAPGIDAERQWFPI